MGNNDEDNIFLQQVSVYNRMLKSTPNDIIKKYLNTTLDNEGLIDGRFTHFEKTLEEIKNIIKNTNNMTLLQMMDSFNNEIYVGRDNFIEELNSRLKRKSKGKVIIDKYGLIINYEINTNGSIKFTRIIDLFNHILSGKGIDATFQGLDRTPINTAFWEAFSKTYPVIDTKKGMFIDLAKITENSNGKFSIMDAIIEFRNIVKTGWATIIDTRINAGHINYTQFVQINDNTQIPLLGLFGSIYKYIPIHKSLFNKELSDFELENGFELFSHLETAYNIITLPDGEFGIMCEGEMICARKSKSYSTLNPVFDIISIKNHKKMKRFRDRYKYKKALDPNYKGTFDEDNGDMIQVKIIETAKEIHTEQDLYNTLVGNMTKSHNFLNSEGGNFLMPYSEANLQRVMYEKDTIWKDFIVADRLLGESDKMYNARQYTLGNMINRFVTQMKIDGMGITENAVKYANSIVNSINGILKNGDMINALDYNQLLDMPVTDVVDLDMKYSFIKPYYSFKNRKISNSNRNFKNQVMTKYLEGNNGKRIKPAEIFDKSKFMNNRINNIINSQKNIDGINKNYLEKILKVKSMKVYANKIETLRNEFKLDIDEEELEKEYLSQKMIYDNFISQIQSYENADILPIRTKIEIYNLAEEHNKITGNNLQIQNFKIQVIDLTDEIIEDNKEIITNTSNKESKALLRKTNTSLRKLKKSLKQNLYILASYENYETNKVKIDLKETCNTLKIQITNIKEDINIIKNDDYICKLNKMMDYVDNILNEVYSIEYYENYSRNLLSLSNTTVNCKEYDYFEQRLKYHCA